MVRFRRMTGVIASWVGNGEGVGTVFGSDRTERKPDYGYVDGSDLDFCGLDGRLSFLAPGRSANCNF